MNTRDTFFNLNSTPSLVETKRILVIDDDPLTCALVQRILVMAGYDVEVATSGSAGLKTYHKFHPDLIILDVFMPGMTGIDFCRRFRQLSSIPVLFLSAYDDEVMMLRGFDCGAVDYVVKPFRRRILLARVKLALRIGALIAATTPVTTYDDGYLNIDPTTHRVTVDGDPVQLTTTELAVLLYLMQDAGADCSIEHILLHVWGDEYRDAAGHVYTYIRRLRRKLERDPQHPEYILSVHGRGYTFKRQRSLMLL